MAEITVSGSRTGAGWVFDVIVMEGNCQTRHTVTLADADFQRLSQGTSATPETLVNRSVEFLLEREPKESILRRFDLPVIARYFPEYPTEIRKRL